MRTLKYVLNTAVLAASLLIAAPAGATGPNQEDAMEGWQPALLSSEPLFNGSVTRRRYEGGVTVVAATGARVIFGGNEKVAETRRAGRTIAKRTITRSMSVALPVRKVSPRDARDYEDSGRSVYADAIAAGFSPRAARQMAESSSGNTAAENPPVWDSGCLSIDDDPDYQWSGCYQRYVTEDADPNAYYSSESGKAWGWGTGILGGGKELIRGYSQHDYTNPYSEMVDADPSSSVQDSSGCYDVSLGVSHIASVSISVPFCPARWVAIRDTYVHHAEWQGGSAGGPSDTVSAGNVTQVRNPEGTFGFYVYGIGATVVCFC